VWSRSLNFERIIGSGSIDIPESEDHQRTISSGSLKKIQNQRIKELAVSIKVIHKVTFSFTPYPLSAFTPYPLFPQSKEILLNLSYEMLKLST
jgi:hypothetical protein